MRSIVLAYAAQSVDASAVIVALLIDLIVAWQSYCCMRLLSGVVDAAAIETPSSGGIGEYHEIEIPIIGRSDGHLYEREWWHGDRELTGTALTVDLDRE